MAGFYGDSLNLYQYPSNLFMNRMPNLTMPNLTMSSNSTMLPMLPMLPEMNNLLTSNLPGLYGLPGLSDASINNNSSNMNVTNTVPPKPEITAADENIAISDAAKWLAEATKEHQDVSSALVATGQFVAFENLHKIRHPFLTYDAVKETNKIFKPKNKFNAAKVAKVWKANPEVMKDAYSEILQAKRSIAPKGNIMSGWWRKSWTGKDKGKIEKIIRDLEKAIKNNKPEEVVKLTAELKAAKAFNGKIPSALNWCKNLFKSKTSPNRAVNLSVAERIAKGQDDVKKAVDLYKAAQTATTSAKALTFGGKVLKEFKGFAIFEGIVETVTKVIPAFNNGGKERGMKQATQSAVKIGASCAAWAVGRTAGSAIGAKIGAAIGTACCPGLGTAVGAVIGIGLGCLASWAAEKAVEWAIPVEETEVMDAEAKLKDKETRKQVLSEVVKAKQQGLEIPENVLKSMETLAYTA